VPSTSPLPLYCHTEHVPPFHIPVWLTAMHGGAEDCFRRLGAVHNAQADSVLSPSKQLFMCRMPCYAASIPSQHVGAYNCSWCLCRMPCYAALHPISASQRIQLLLLLLLLLFGRQVLSPARPGWRLLLLSSVPAAVLLVRAGPDAGSWGSSLFSCCTTSPDSKCTSVSLGRR
jgi:hypothetical protein